MASHQLNSENNGRTNGLGRIFYSSQSLSPASNFAKTLQINLFSHFSSFFAQIHFFATIRDSGKPPFLFRWSKRLKRWCWRFEREKIGLHVAALRCRLSLKLDFGGKTASLSLLFRFISVLLSLWMITLCVERLWYNWSTTNRSIW